ncbi:receptor-type tyrosine-protein phosphatase kappa-like [Patiria miniata]|uniref:protein-tyrosine-phosphatase n=1 Tax=Patiria miniata TaxID=46514 RepID=A0A913ZB32_PATMI|nr:receptor-type tyrosine-protein phosphatase kappa-like [Patiria miniata]
MAACSLRWCRFYALVLLIVVNTALSLDVRGKPAEQSSTAPDENGLRFEAGKAVDGNITIFSKTAEMLNPWWRLDLEAVYCLKTITIIKGVGMDGAEVRAGLSPDRSPNTLIGTVGVHQVTIMTAVPVVTARYVSVDFPGDNKIINLAEVTVEEFVDEEALTSTVDFTFVANPALINSTGGKDVVLTAYKGPDDIPAGVSFGRQLATGGMDGLPPGSTEEDKPSLECKERSLRLPAAAGISRVGVFYFEGRRGSINTRIQIVMLPNDSVQIRPVQRTQIANVGDSVRLEMQNVNAQNTNYMWRHNGSDVITSWNDQLNVTIDDVAVSDGGVYSCFVSDQEDQQLHGIMRLIVRGCSDGRWGLPSCLNLCRRCYNGGVCDDNTGNCVCAPGFSGENCEQVHGRDVFGQNARHRCSDTTDPHDDACRGRLFCLPDPYGCSCAAGYVGLNCMQECPEGKYGADCKQTCHCASSETCSKDTGNCSNGTCAIPYFGINCQCSMQDPFPGQVITRSVMQRNISFSWSKVVCLGSDLQGYQYKLSQANTGPLIKPPTNTTDTSTTIDGLTPYVDYNFQVAFYTTMSTGSFSSILTVRTTEAEPTAPLNVSITTADNQYLAVVWTEPDPPQGIITNYDVAYWVVGNESSRVDVYNRSTAILSYQLSDLVVNVTYSMQVRAKTSVGVGPWSEVINETAVGVPGHVQNLHWTERSETSLTIAWEQPLNPMGPRTYYVVKIRAVEKPYQPGFTAGVTYTEYEADSSPYTEANLQPGTKYEFRVSAKNGILVGMPSVLEVYTKPLSDPPAPRNPMTYDNEATETTVTIGLRAVLPEDDTFVESFIVHVKKVETSRRRAALIANHFEDSAGDYIAAEMTKDSVPDKFTVGDGKVYGGYYNAPLKTGVAYSIRVGSVSQGNEMEASVTFSDPIIIQTASLKAGNSVGIAFGVIVPVLLLIAVVIAVVVFKRRSKETRHQPDTNGVTAQSTVDLTDDCMQDEPTGASNAYAGVQEVNPSSPPTPAADTTAPATPSIKKKSFKAPPPVRIDVLADYIKKKEAAGDGGFKADYKTLPNDQLHPWTVASKPENKKKNRFANVIPYDHSRVVLTPVEKDPHSDYINACYVDGYSETDKYIASQGPNNASLNDMWRMVWQMNVDKIVMLTNPVENGKTKCLQYWPDTGVTAYANITVTIIDEQTFLDHTIRQFNITEVNEEETRHVKQFHYTTWPDMKPPEYPAPLLNFMRVVNAEHNEGRTIIHCSAGVGRTGTYICLESMLEQIKQEGQVNVLAFIHRMRQNRIKMVQTPEQYKFLFDALLAASLTGETTYDMTTFRRQLTSLKKKEPGSKDKGMEKQFQHLSELRVSRASGSSKAGKLPENVEKNRYEDFIPTDRARPFLMTNAHEDDTNYINAHFLPGYRKKDRYITTQMPMPNTTADIWRLVYDQKATCIVMLNHLDEEDDTMCRYWPDKGSIEFGPLVVKLLRSTTHKGVIENTFSLQNKTKSEPARNVCQFQIQDWPSDQEVPSSRQGMFTLMELTQKWHEERPPIVVHCMDGLGRTAVYCTLMSMTEQFQEEKVADVFQAALRLRLVHPSMMYSLDHYAMCYDVFQANLDSSTVYENLHLKP